MYTYIINDELIHHGVKGQRWGVRKKPTFSQMKNKYYDLKNSAQHTSAYKELNKERNSLKKNRNKSQKNYNEWEKSNTIAERYTSKKAVDGLIKEYGIKNYNKFIRKNNVLKGAATVSTMTIIGAPIGFKLSNKSVVGVGESYELKKRYK